MADYERLREGAEWLQAAALEHVPQPERGRLADILDALPELLAKAEAHDALVAAVEGVAHLTEGPNREGTARWPDREREVYSLAIEEATAALRAATEDAGAATRGEGGQ